MHIASIIGKIGESIATDYLITNSYKVLARNWRTTTEEIDILAQKDSFLVVIEVKTRTSKKYGNPEEAVNYSKQKRLVEAADKYIRKFDIQLETRFDIISIVILNDEHFLNHITNAFSPFD